MQSCKYQKEGTFEDRKSSGRPRVFSCREDHVMRKVVICSPISSSKRIQAKLMERWTVVSAKMIQRRLSLDFGLKSCKPARKQCLTQAMRKKHLDFAKRHVSWDTEMWKKVHVSGESSVQQFSVRRYQVWRPVGTCYEEKYTTPTAKHPRSQVIWGAMSPGDSWTLFFATGNHHEWWKIC